MGVILLISGCGFVLTQYSEDEVIKNLGLQNGLLKSCPNRDNCRNSDDPQERFQITAISDPAGSKWQRLDEIMTQLPRTKLVSETDSYRHYTQTSKVMRFIDDIEFHYRPESGEIAVRSASRLGYRDFGVNMQRIESVRTLLGQ